jgi:hypothetical protein
MANGQWIVARVEATIAAWLGARICGVQREPTVCACRPSVRFNRNNVVAIKG